MRVFLFIMASVYIYIYITAASIHAEMAGAAIRRLAKEKQKLDESRVRDFYACPLNDIFEWHFTLQGPPNSPYEGGLYHGAIMFPRNYPFSPPDIIFLTNSGRFEVGKKICSTISSYHPELWKPVYDIELVLVALRSFMAQEEELGVGSLQRRYVTSEEKRHLARESHQFSCPTCGMTSAWDVWKTQMEQYPPVSSEVEANVPKSAVKTRKKEEDIAPPAAATAVEVGKGEEASMTTAAVHQAASNTPAANITNSAAQTAGHVEGKEEESHACGDRVDQDVVKVTPAVAPATVMNKASGVSFGATRVMAAKNGEDETSTTAMKYGDAAKNASAHTSEATAATTEGQQQGEDVHGGLDTMGIGSLSHSPKASGQGQGQGEEAVSLVGSVPPVFVRIQLGNWVLFRVQLKQIDVAIAACSFICFAVIFKKWLWS
ncbi:ubiquitin-conjugating enzyme [Trypanosoma cruzi cruzi]|nr:ubiquitin-conjugating enzyme [Trypanosoma cruzi cruzi]PWU89799.1 putative ubiquitin-conjugating enzyme E2 [Trypanosoma cruzi]